MDNQRVCKDELAALASSATVSNLERESGTSGTIKDSLNNFANTSNLTGTGWESVKTKISAYSSALSKGSEIASELGTKISEALEKLQPFFDQYDSLDPSNLPELRNTLSELKSTLASLPATVFDHYDVKTDATTGEEIKTAIYKDNPDIETYNGLIAEAEALITVLEAFQAACEEVLASLQEIFSKIDAYTSEIDNIVPSNLYTYVPASVAV